MSRWLVRAAVSVTVAVLLVIFIPLGDVWSALREVRPWVWIASLAVFFGGHYLNALKLRLLIGPTLVDVAPAVQAQFAGLAANLGLPGLAGGDVVRAAYLAPSAGMTRVAMAGIGDRVLDTLVLIAIVSVAIPLAGVPAGLADRLQSGFVVLAALATAGLLLAMTLFWACQRGLRSNRLDRVWTEMRARRAMLGVAAAISLLVQSTFVITNVWLAREVGVTTAVAAWFVVWPVSKLVAVLPISLGGLGVREAALVSLLAQYGAPGDGVLASGILWEGVLIVGGVSGMLVTQLGRRQKVDAPGSQKGGAS